jgi:hypothetical protein
MEQEIVMNSPVTPKKSNGQLFKEKFGYSKTMKSLIKKNNVSTIEEYKEIRKARKKKENKMARDHRALVQAKGKSKPAKK